MTAALWLGLLGIAAMILAHPLRIATDCAMYLQAGQLLLEGQRPYVDFIDLNPPLIIYFSAIPAALAKISPLHAITTFNLFVWVLVAASVMSTYRLLRRLPSPRWLAHVFAAALVIAQWQVLTSDHGPPPHNFWGQREHLFVCAAIPWLALRLLRSLDVPVPRGTAIAVGFLAGTVACLKPHFVVMLCLVEVVYLSRGWRRLLVQPEVASLIAAGVLYVVHFALLPEAVRDAFFHRWLPYITSHYRAFDSKYREMAILDDFGHGFEAALIALVAAVVFRSADSAARRLTLAMGIFAAAGAGMMLFEHKGWPYHQIPGNISLTCVVALVGGMCVAAAETQRPSGVLLTLLRGLVPLSVVLGIGSRNFVVLWAALPVGLFAFLASTPRTVPFRWTRLPPVLVPMLRGFLVVGTVAVIVLAGEARQAGAQTRDPDATDIAVELARHTRPGDSVLILNTSLATAYPALVQDGLRPASRYLWFFPWPMLFDDSPQAQNAEEQELLDEISADIARTRPPVVMIPPTTCFKCPLGFSLEDHLRDNGFIARELPGYRRIKDRVGTLSVYVAPGR